MYSLERLKKMEAVTLILSIAFFIISGFSYAGGGYELIKHDFLNEAFASILMVAAFIGGFILLLVFFIMAAIHKDLKDYIKILEQRYLLKEK